MDKEQYVVLPDSQRQVMLQKLDAIEAEMKEKNEQIADLTRQLDQAKRHNTIHLINSWGNVYRWFKQANKAKRQYKAELDRATQRETALRAALQNILDLAIFMQDDTRNKRDTYYVAKFDTAAAFGQEAKKALAARAK